MLEVKNNKNKAEKYMNIILIIIIIFGILLMFKNYIYYKFFDDSYIIASMELI